jgi:hypothetical protein
MNNTKTKWLWEVLVMDNNTKKEVTTFLTAPSLAVVIDELDLEAKEEGEIIAVTRRVPVIKDLID